ncbi:MAG TPA: hypothetical protein VFG87_06540 [Amycolatopsis sp.]|jgi:hypothetical protein|nr:hypothetical protein [Amycolatopsis sp.]
MRDNGFSAGFSAGFPAVSERHETPDDTELVAEQRRRAVRAIASAATDADDCATLLDALGLRPSEGLASVPSPRSAD